MAQIDFSLQNRIPDGNGKLLVGDLSPTDGSYTTEQQYLEWMKGKILYSGYLYNGDFYKESAHTNVISKVDGVIYVDLTDSTNLSLYYCDNTTYKPLTEEAQVQAIRTELANGTLVPLKAKQDQNGNVIDQTYETKADASDLKDAIQANSKRIENLEEKAGDYTEVDVKSVYSVPTGKAKNMVLVGVEGRSRVKNNICNVTLTTQTVNTVVFTNNGDGTITVSGTATADTNVIVAYMNTLAGRSYSLCGCPSGGSVSTFFLNTRGNNLVDTGSGDYKAFTSDVEDRVYITVKSGVNINKTFTPCLCDVTQYFNGSVPTGLNLATIQSDYPWLLTPSSYGTSMVKTRYEGFRSYDSSNNLIAEVTLPTPIELGSAGSVAEEAYLNEDGEAWKTNPLGSADFNGTDSTGWSYIGAYGTAYRFDCSSIVGKVGGEVISNLFIKGAIGTADLECIELHGGDGHLMLQVSASRLNNSATVTALMTFFISNNLEVNYELATPDDPTPLTVLTDNWIATEGGGTLEATKTYPIDDSFTVGYLTL